MKIQIKRLSSAIVEFPKLLDAIPDTVFDDKPLPDKWSKKELVGHLVDSALNNIQRFVRAQHTPMGKFVYEQDEWVRVQDYQHADREELVVLWTQLNRQLVRIWTNMPESKLKVTCDVGKEKPQRLSLLELAVDYNDHLDHHAKQILS